MKVLELVRPGLGVGLRFLRIDWALVILLVLVASIGFAILHSAADGNPDRWVRPQMTRFAGGMLVMIAIGLVNVRIWARLAYPVYVVALVLLAAVEFAGAIGMGAQRWIEIGPVRVQPSEMMKVALVLALARFFSSLEEEDAGRWWTVVIPLVAIAAPAALVLRQPDLGTAVTVALGGLAVVFLAGVSWWLFAAGGVLAAGAAPVVWGFLKSYQQERVLTFLDPERDPLGAGYQIIQSKIAIGSGGGFGKGFIEGTQGQLGFLPENHTDFVFTMIAEEFGFAGAVFTIGLYVLILFYCYAIALRVNGAFARLLTLGISFTFFIYIAVNIAMVIGLVPVVGVPLPFISYGGSAMLTLQIGFGLVLSARVHGDIAVGRDRNGPAWKSKFIK